MLGPRWTTMGRGSSAEMWDTARSSRSNAWVAFPTVTKVLKSDGLGSGREGKTAVAPPTGKKNRPQANTSAVPPGRA
jgi:hypothetical protein